MSKSIHRTLKWIICTGILLLFLIIQTDQFQIASANHMKEEGQNEHDRLTHNEIVSLTDQFIELLVTKTNHNNKVINYKTKKGLLKDFEKIATRDVASTYVDFYFREKEDGLYIVPTETPPWFNKKNDYDMVQLENNKINVKQENKSALYGTYTIIYEFTLDNSQWKITKITH